MFFKSSVFISCFGCSGCNVLYDPVHDEHFSEVCGLIVMCNNVCCVDVGDDVDGGLVVRYLFFDDE